MTVKSFTHRQARFGMPVFLSGLVLLAFLALVVMEPLSAHAATKRKASAPNNRYAAIVIDADTGAVLHESSADKKLHPASLVKMMTLLLAFEALQQGNLTLNTRLPISSHAAAQPPSKLGLTAGSSIVMKDAIYALVTKSANDIAVAMGESIGGSESRFVAMMNQKAREIGMTNTHFQNASGLHHPSQVSSARDIARLSRYIIQNYPTQYKYFSTAKFSYKGLTHRNHNRLMETYQGMDGIKTGYIQPSGFNLAASAVRGSHRLIAVVFGGRTTQSRNDRVAALLDQGFAKLRAGGDVRIARADSAPAAVVASMAPIPDRKPSTRDTVQDAGAAQLAMQEETMGASMGEGDFDPAVARRYETGVMAITALKGIGNPSPVAGGKAEVSPVEQASFTPQQDETGINAANDNDWAIQIGAFTSRVRSDETLTKAIEKLPKSLKTNAKTVIVPLKAGEGWVFRARIRGLSREQAVAACKYFKTCMAISPRAY
jgi:D-alanyl-D-alanine carboxypeptidase